MNVLSSLLAETIVTPPRPVSEFLAHFWPVAAVSFLLALVATPLCRKLAHKCRVVDVPDDFLKPHKRPIPYLGGVAICAGWVGGILIGLLVGWWWGWYPVRPAFLVGIAVAGILIMVVGLLDDMWNMSPKLKLALNIAVGLLLLGVGVGQNSFHIFVRASVAAYDQDPSLHLVELVFSIPLTLFIIVGACNATNLIDGMDGMCSGVLAIISLGFLGVALHLASYSPEQALSSERLVLALAMLGAALGFLPYNVNPASIFMGDAGSMLLGLNAAVLILLFCDPGIIKWLLCAVIVFGLPIADMMLTLLRRWRNARPLMKGDRSHFYDQLVDRGYSVRQVVAISYVLSILFAAIGCGAAIFLRTRYVLMLCVGLVVVGAFVIGRFRMVELSASEGGFDGAGTSTAARSGGDGGH